MRGDWFRAASCEGKAKFESAKLALKVARRRGKANGIMRNQKPYKCPLCGHFHIGTQPKRAERRRPKIFDLDDDIE